MKSIKSLYLAVVYPLAFALISLVAFSFSPAAFAQNGPASPPPVPYPGEPPYFAIKDARIVTVSGPAIEKGTVVIANGLIQAVGADVSIPPEALVIDGSGLTVYPGLIDAGTQVGLPSSAPGGPPAAGSRGPRSRMAPEQISRGPQDRPATTPWNVAANDLDPNDPRIASWRDAGFTTALVAPVGGMFPGQGSVIDFAEAPAGAMVVKPHATMDLSFQPTGGFWSFPGSLMGVIAYVRQVFIDTRWYSNAESIYNSHPDGLQRPAYDRTEVVIGQALLNHELFLLPALDKLAIFRAVRLANEYQIPAAIYGAQNAYELADVIAHSKMPVFIDINWPTMTKGADTDDITLRELRFWDRAPSTPAELQKAGILFTFYSGGIANPKDVFKNVRKSIDAGLSAEDALRAMTINPAKILGVDDRLGSIEPGKIANLVVADGDIFGEKTKIKDVFVDGLRYEIHEEASPGPPGRPGAPMPMNSSSSKGVQQ